MRGEFWIFPYWHKGYATKLNDLTRDKPEGSMTLEQLIANYAVGTPITNNDAQVFCPIHFRNQSGVQPQHVLVVNGSNHSQPCGTYSPRLWLRRRKFSETGTRTLWK
ncbi:hypothetical protein Pelo_19047 [Pelomyxa schiedti]|nr:hypothetical protein Pelo_19047 [Pelomyxa schiedti]